MSSSSVFNALIWWRYIYQNGYIHIYCLLIILRNMTCIRYFNLHTDTSAAQKRFCFKCKMTSFKLWILRDCHILVVLDLSAAFSIIDHQKLEVAFWGGSNHIPSTEIKLFKLGLAHPNLWHRNKEFYKDQYLELFYLPCTPPSLVTSAIFMMCIYAHETQLNVNY